MIGSFSARDGHEIGRQPAHTHLVLVDDAAEVAVVTVAHFLGGT